MVRSFGLQVLFILLTFWYPAFSQIEDSAALHSDERLITVSEKRNTLLGLLKQAREFEAAGKRIDATRLMNRAGRLQLRLNLQQEALTTYQKALALTNEEADLPSHIDSLNGVGSAYTQIERCEKAQPFLERAITLSRQNMYVLGEAYGLLILSDCENYSDHSLALQTAQRSLQLWQSINDKWGIARSLTVIGHYQLAQNDLDGASRSHQAALTLWRELNLVDQEAESLIYLGFIEYRKGAWEESISFLTQAQTKLNEESNPFQMGQVAAGIAEAFIESGLPEYSLPKLDEAKRHFARAQAPRSVFIMLWDIGKALYLMGRYDDALQSLSEALAGSASLKDRANEAMCHDFIGRTYAAMNDFDKALHHLQLASDLYLPVGDVMESERTRVLIGQINERKGRFDLARQDYQHALKIFRRLSDRLNESEALFASGRLELKLENFSLAEDYFNQAIQLTENIRRSSTSSDLSTALSATLHNRYQDYIDCLMRHGLPQNDKKLTVRAFEMSELARGRSLAEMLRATETNFLPALDPQLSEREKSLRLALRLKEDARIRLLTSSYKKEELDKLEQELKGLEVDYQRVRDEIGSKFPAFAEITQPRGWELKRIQQEVIRDDDTVLVEYSLGNERSYAWTITRDGFESFQLAAESEINTAAQKVYELLQSNNARAGELEQATQALSQMILFPVASQIQKRRLIVIADGSLNYIPFQVLPTFQDNKESLIARFEIINAPSASVLGQLRQETNRRPEHSSLLAAFGDAAFATDFAQRKKSEGDSHIASAAAFNGDRWQHALRDIELTGDKVNASSIQRLVYAQRELNNLRQIAGPGSFIATGFDATRENLQQTDLSKYAILHFATHGVLDPKHPENSGLFLSMVDRDGKSQNGFIDLRDIYNLRAPVDLVVLSACRTGLGKDVRGEGLIGLTRGFMYAGASSVVASLWKVDDEATAELMKQFYFNMLEKQMNPAAALRAAQVYIRQQPQWRSPYYWGAFTLQGEYNKLIVPPHRSRLPFVLGAIVCLLLLGSAYLFYRSWKVRNVTGYSTLNR
ncbi:MAG TPA: CHAT domain-containing tetratricopeptide repeat protein [Pyrinomonadaceae bacterium]